MFATLGKVQISFDFAHSHRKNSFSLQCI